MSPRGDAPEWWPEGEPWPPRGWGEGRGPWRHRRSGRWRPFGCLILLLHLFKGPGRRSLVAAVRQLDETNYVVLLTGLGLLAIGTLLGGVWANEAWGRYWGWDAKETWSLATILVYAIVLHFRWVPALNRPWPKAAGSFAAIASVLMTYFGVNYFLSGLHSYAEGDIAAVPSWAYVLGAGMLLLILVSGLRDRSRRWD